jgi:hypothetical protein
MLTRIKGKIAFVCDECDDGLETEEYELDRARKVFKEAGWLTIKNPDADEGGLRNGRRQPPFLDLCKDCAK